MRKILLATSLFFAALSLSFGQSYVRSYVIGDTYFYDDFENGAVENTAEAGWDASEASDEYALSEQDGYMSVQVTEVTSWNGFVLYVEPEEPIDLSNNATMHLEIENMTDQPVDFRIDAQFYAEDPEITGPNDAGDEVTWVGTECSGFDGKLNANAKDGVSGFTISELESGLNTLEIDYSGAQYEVDCDANDWTPSYYDITAEQYSNFGGFYIVVNPNNGGTPWSGEIRFHSIRIGDEVAAAPDAPENVVVTGEATYSEAGTPQQAANISWNPVAGAENYIIGYSSSTEPSSFIQLLDTAAVTSGGEDVDEFTFYPYEEAPLNPNTEYHFVVGAAGDGTPVAWSDVTTITTPPDVAPRNFEALTVNAYSVEFGWEPAATEDAAYTIQRTLEGEDNWVTAASVEGETSAIATGLSSQTTYEFRMWSSNSYGNSDTTYLSGDNAVTTGDTPASAPENAPGNISAEGVGPSSVLLSWDPADYAGWYHVRYSTDGTNWTDVEGDIAETSYIVEGLEAGTEYEFQVRAANDLGESGYSASVTGSTTASLDAPENFEAVDMSSSSVELNWDQEDPAPADIVYNIRYSRNNGISWTTETAVSAEDVPPYLIEDLVPNTTYIFQVQAVSTADGAMSEFVEAEATTWALGLAGKSKEAVNLNIFPNPASGKATVDFNMTSGKSVELFILNSVGTLVATHEVSSANASFDVSDLNKGMYMVQIVVDGETIDMKKLMVE